VVRALQPAVWVSIRRRTLTGKPQTPLAATQPATALQTRNNSPNESPLLSQRSQRPQPTNATAGRGGDRGW